MHALTGATRTKRLHVVALLARRSLRASRHRLGAPARWIGRWRAGVPDRVVVAPQDIRTSDPTIAADIIAGYFAFGGKIVTAAAQSPFAVESGSDLWLRQLAGFGWLRHLRAADSVAERERGRVLVDQFLAALSKPSHQPAWEPRVVARRVLSWLSQSPIILTGADRDFYTRFLQALARHASHLEGLLAGSLTGSDRLLVALALAEYGLCVEGGPALQARSTEALAAEINAQILPDGGHISRNPQVLIDLLLDLLPLRQVYAARSVAAPTQLLNAIDRMMPMLRLFRHADGALALFNGMGPTAPELVATILAYDDVRAQPIANARYSGYQRLEAGGTVVVIESGAPPPQAFSTSAHAGCLSFELSSDSYRLVVNCGAVETARAGIKEASRSTAAHSTLVIADTSCCRFATGAGLMRLLGDQILSGPAAVTAERSRRDGGTAVAASHDGYAGLFGFEHRRTLVLADDGARLDGEDRLVETGKSADVDFALRFHLHPGIKARASADGAVVQLEAPDGAIWAFEATADAFVEPSVLFAATGGPRPTVQIKLTGKTGITREVRWSFRRVSSGRRPSR